MTIDSALSEESHCGSPSQGGAFEAVEAVVRDGYFDGMLRRLQASFPRLPQQTIEDALYGAAEKCAKRHEAPDNVRAWLYSAARHLLLDVTRRKPTETYDVDNPDHEVEVSPSAEDEALSHDTYRVLVKHVEGWPVSKMRVVVLIVLAAADDGEPLSNADLAKSAGGVLGQAMSTGTAAVLKSRGLDRLRTEYPSIFPRH